MKKIRTISILGPTASGKTGLAIELAGRLSGEVVSCDSMQLYRGMDIGTATPTIEEQKGIPHHLFDIITPDMEFSAADYARVAGQAVEEIAARGNLPILCGGTGMYHDALMKLTSFSPGERDDRLRAELMEFAKLNGNCALHEKLAEIDPEAAEAIHPNNVIRVIRAIEVYRTTGKTKTETDREQTSGETPYNNTPIILDFTNRELLYKRIDMRVDMMIESGLVEEAKRILSIKGLSKTAYQAIGYKEFEPYFRGECSLKDAAETIKLATRHYAKRQMIWFRHKYDGIRIAPDRDDAMRSSCDMADEILERLEL